MKTWRRSLLDQTFHAGIMLKGLDGALEVLGGLLLWFLKPVDLNEIVRFLLQHDLSRDTHNWISEHLLHAAAKTADANPAFASFFLLSHGVTKIALVLGLWMKKLWAYPLTIAVFAAFCVYQTYRYALTHSAWMLVLTILDLALVYLTWEQCRQQVANLHSFPDSRAALGAKMEDKLTVVAGREEIPTKEWF
jgi:uncharacterized membrane protein